ncbi:hypothetical protein O988_02808 [Pseudogymnoascus sp. VKM F-3808]|nr:hypothetical protein O988_02808 [Pseudogymnoascus sp. VKM F-3808]
MVYGMIINEEKISAGDANMTTPTRRGLRSRLTLDRQNSANPRNGLNKIIEEEDDKGDEEYYVADEENSDDETDDDSEEEDMGSDSEDESENDDDNDEYEEDFVDDETEDSEDSQATFLPSTHISDTDSNEDEEASGNENEDVTLSLVEELENLGIKPDESNI